MNISDMLPVGITLVVVTVALAFGLQVMGDVKDDIGADSCKSGTGFTNYNATANQCYNSSYGHQAVGTSQFNGTEDGIEGLSKLTGKLPTIGLVIAAVIIIGILVKGFQNAA